MNPCTISGKIFHQVLVLIFSFTLLTLVTFSGQTKPSKVFASSKILRCYDFCGFPHSLIHFISCFYWQLSRTTEPKYHRPGCAVPKRLVPHQVRLPFSLWIESLPLPVFHFGGLFWARSMERTLGAPSPGQPSWRVLPCALQCSHVKTVLKPDLAGGETYISLNDTLGFVKYLLCAWHCMAVIAFIFSHKLSYLLFSPFSR